MSRKQILIGLSAVVLLALGIAAYFVLSPSGATSAAESGPGFTLTPHDRTMGNPKAKVTLIEYAAPSCPVCARFNADTSRRSRRIISTPARFFMCSGCSRCGRTTARPRRSPAVCLRISISRSLTLLFRNQPKWDVEYGVQDVHGGLVLLGRIAGMSAEQVDKCMSDTKEDETINSIAKDGEARYSITGTPTIVVDGVSAGSHFFTYNEIKHSSIPPSPGRNGPGGAQRVRRRTLLKFTRLRLSGFKSFVEPTELYIEPGLTAVIGPNGCGKSNLFDALRWVMGETRPSSVRGSEMDDVIFAGSTARPAPQCRGSDLADRQYRPQRRRDLCRT